MRGKPSSQQLPYPLWGRQYSSDGRALQVRFSTANDAPSLFCCPAGRLCRLMGGAGKTVFSFVGKWCVLSCSWFFACPAGAKTTFSFAQQKKKRFWTPKKKRQTGGNDYGLRYNRAKPQSCLGIPWVKSFGLSFCFRRLAFERPVAPLAPLPLSGRNTAPCPLVSTPPGWVVFGKRRAKRVRTPAPTGWDGF